MNFRQRIAWVLVGVFLAATCGMAYYIFEISDRFSEYALEHVESYHSGGVGGGAVVVGRGRAALPPPGGVLRGVAGVGGDPPAEVAAAGGGSSGGDGWLVAGRHLMDIPLAVWLVLLVLPYLQVFCLLLACTKAEPRYSPAYLWPLFVYLKCRTIYHRWAHPVVKSFNSPVANGHGHGLLLDT